MSALENVSDSVSAEGRYIEGERRHLVLTPASTIKPRRVRWLWDGRLALGSLGLLAGREGIGKSAAAYWLAAEVTRGQLPGEHKGEPRAVLVCATEDAWEETIVPRLMAADVDLTKVFRVEVVMDSGTQVDLRLPSDLSALEREARAVGAALVLLDPLMSRLGSLDTHRDAEVRQALEPLVRSAQRAGLAVLGLIHHNKSATSDPMQAVMGSRAFTAVARSVHTVVTDPDDETLRVFGTPKNNLGRSDLPSLSFRIEGATVDTDEGPAETSRIVWGGEVAGSISSTMRRASESPDDRTKTDEAGEWLRAHLEARGGTEDSAAVKYAAREARHSGSALQNARQRIGVTVRSEGFPRRTYWSLPQAEPSRAVAVGERDD